MNRTKGVLILVVAMTIAAVGGWVAASQIESPAEAAARTEAPPPSPILVPAELQELSTDVITRGTGRLGSPETISIPISPLKGDIPQVLTGIPASDEELEQGTVGLRISGRPVFIFEGQIPSFRDLGPGMRGADIAQLEAGLTAIGLDPGPADGVYDAATEQAVVALYTSAGYEPVSVTAAQLEELNPAGTGIIPGSQSSDGVHLPADEIFIVTRAPVRLAELFITVGEVIDGPVGTMTDATVAIDSSVPIESAGLISEGMDVLIDEPDLGIEASGTISRVADNPGTDGVDGFHVYFEVLIDDNPTNIVNASVRLTIPIEFTGEAVLVVPVSALTLGADGSSQVQRQVGDTLEAVVVEPGLSANGLVEVSSVDGELDVGDLVVVGYE